MKKVSLFFVAMCVMFSAAVAQAHVCDGAHTHGHDNVLYSEIQQAKEKNLYFENATLPKVSPNVEILNYFTNPDEVSFFGNISLDLKNNPVKAMDLSLPLNNEIMILELVEVPKDFYDYVVTTSGGEIFSANKDIKHYRGIIKDDIHSTVAITFYEDEIMGLICTDEGNFNIVKDQQSNKYLFYNDNNLKEKTTFTCGNTDDFFHGYEPEVLLGQREWDTENKKVRFYVETEYDIFQNKGSIASVETLIAGLFNQVAILYQNENIATGISELYIWTSEDPYNGTNTGSLIVQFQNKTTSINGDLGILLTFRTIGGGQAAGFSGLCNPDVGQSLSVAFIDRTYKTVPVFSWSVMVVTHELGHLFGSRHTHACVWNGDNTAIDGCAGYVEGYCTLPGNPPEGGTMMSYCHNASVGINFNLGFGPQPGNVIRNNVINADCLVQLVLEIMDVRLPDEISEINPGETSDLHIYLKNIGDDTASDLTALLTTTSPYLIINKDTEYYGYLAPEQYKYRAYNITIAPETPAGITEAPITLTITDESGRTIELDAIFHFQNTGETPQTCNSIEDLSAEVIDHDIVLTWTAPSEGVPEKYFIYCNGLFLGETATTTYTHEKVKLGIYHYCIETVFENGCIGEWACVEAITPCNLTIALTVKAYVNGNRLSWTPTVENARYKIYRNAEFIEETEKNGYSDTDTGANIDYCYTIIAVCPDDSESNPSNEACIPMVGIDEMENDVRIYPNPTDGVLYVETDNYPFLQNVEIFDVFGRTVVAVGTNLRVRPENQNPESQLGVASSLRLDISHLPTGIYFIRIQTENGTILRKVVKQ